MSRDCRPAGRGGRRGRRRGGFTLLEILIAMLILILVLTSVLSLFGAATASHRRAVSSQNAAQLAWTVLAELEQVRRPAQLQAIAGQTHPAFDGYVYDIAFNRVGPNEIEAAVTVRWKRSGKDESRTYRTILLDR